MIKRSANGQGVITFNISFQNSFSSLRRHSTNLQTNSESTFFSPQVRSRKNENAKRMEPFTAQIANRANKWDSTEPSSAHEGFEHGDMSPGLGLMPSFPENFGDNYKGPADDFLTQEPIDFNDFQEPRGFERDEEDRSSISTLSRSSKKICKPLPGTVYKQSRFREEAKTKGKRQPWQLYEDERVMQLVAQHGQSWALISSMMNGRSGKQIRDRYLNKLKPDINNSEWTREDDDQLIELYNQIGRKWSKIATQLPGRTEGQVKNRFYSHIKKRLFPVENSDNASPSDNSPNILRNSKNNSTNDFVFEHDFSEDFQMNNQFNNGARVHSQRFQTVSESKFALQSQYRKSLSNPNVINQEQNNFSGSSNESDEILKSPPKPYLSVRELDFVEGCMNPSQDQMPNQITPEKFYRPNIYSFNINPIPCDGNAVNYEQPSYENCMTSPQTRDFSNLTYEFKNRCSTEVAAGNSIFSAQNLFGNGQVADNERLHSPGAMIISPGKIFMGFEEPMGDNLASFLNRGVGNEVSPSFFDANGRTFFN